MFHPTTKNMGRVLIVLGILALAVLIPLSYGIKPTEEMKELTEKGLEGLTSSETESRWPTVWDVPGFDFFSAETHDTVWLKKNNRGWYHVPKSAVAVRGLAHKPPLTGNDWVMLTAHNEHGQLLGYQSTATLDLRLMEASNSRVATAWKRGDLWLRIPKGSKGKIVAITTKSRK